MELYVWGYTNDEVRLISTNRLLARRARYTWRILNTSAKSELVGIKVHDNFPTGAKITICYCQYCFTYAARVFERSGALSARWIWTVGNSRLYDFHK